MIINIAWYDWCGYVGVVLVVLAFFLLQAAKLHGNGWVYQLMNILGSIGIMLSLVFGTFNLPACVLEAVWTLIGLYGLVASHKRRRRQVAVRGETDVK